jgi:hypothetical protein
VSIGAKDLRESRIGLTESKEPRLQGGALKPKFSKPKIEIPKQVRDDSETGTKPSCHAELVSASGLFFSAFGRRTFHPRPQDGVFRCDLNKICRSPEGQGPDFCPTLHRKEPIAKANKEYTKRDILK